MVLKADGGSTKVEWLLCDKGEEMERFVSGGLNPSLQDEAVMLAEIGSVVRDHPAMLDAGEIQFFGAGCTPAASPKLARCLSAAMPGAGRITVDSDIIGAATALFGTSEGIACILGTGACSCLWGKVDATSDRTYDGMGIVRQTPSLGYILGDEGSGAVLGRMFINALYKGHLPESLREEFEATFSVDMFGIINKVYRQPSANRWLASLSPFVSSHIGIPEVEAMVRENLRMFLTRNILPYGRPDLDVSFVGSIAYYYEPLLRSEAENLGIRIGRVVKSPL